MRILVLALAAAATLGLAVPASASENGARGAAVEKQSQAQDFSSSHRRHWRRHHWRHHRWHRHHYRHCDRFWRHGRLITVCR